MPTDKPNVHAIQSRRTQANVRVLRGRMSDVERIAELELEVDKLIQLVLQQKRDIEDIDERQWKLMRLIGKKLGISRKKSKPNPVE